MRAPEGPPIEIPEAEDNEELESERDRLARLQERAEAAWRGLSEDQINAVYRSGPEPEFASMTHLNGNAQEFANFYLDFFGQQGYDATEATRLTADAFARLNAQIDGAAGRAPEPEEAPPAEEETPLPGAGGGLEPPEIPEDGVPLPGDELPAEGGAPDRPEPRGRISPLREHRRARRPAIEGERIENEAAVAEARERRINNYAEVIRNGPKNAEELVAMVDTLSFQEFHQLSQEAKYGNGVGARLKQFFSGERDFSIDENGEVVAHRGREVARRLISTVGNRRTLSSLAAFTAIGLLTGGVGWASGGVLMGGVAGRLTAEAKDLFSGRNGTTGAREEVLLAEREKYEQLKELAAQWHLAKDPEGNNNRIAELEAQLQDAEDHGAREEELSQLRLQIENAKQPDPTYANDLMRAMIDIYHDQDESAIMSRLHDRGYENIHSGQRLREAKMTLKEREDAHSKLVNRLQTVGEVVGGGAGLAQSVLGGNVEAVDLDYLHKLAGQHFTHNLVMHDGIWHFLYHNAAESAAAHAAGAHVVGGLGSYGGHVLAQVGGKGVEVSSSLIAATAAWQRVLPVLMTSVIAGAIGRRGERMARDKQEVSNLAAQTRGARALYETVPTNWSYFDKLAKDNHSYVPSSPANFPAGWFLQPQMLEKAFAMRDLPRWLKRYPDQTQVTDEEGRFEKVAIGGVDVDRNDIVIVEERKNPTTGAIIYPAKRMRLDEFLKIYAPPIIDEKPGKPAVAGQVGGSSGGERGVDTDREEGGPDDHGPNDEHDEERDNGSPPNPDDVDKDNNGGPKDKDKDKTKPPKPVNKGKVDVDDIIEQLRRGLEGGAGGGKKTPDKDKDKDKGDAGKEKDKDKSKDEPGKEKDKEKPTEPTKAEMFGNLYDLLRSINPTELTAAGITVHAIFDGDPKFDENDIPHGRIEQVIILRDPDGNVHTLMMPIQDGKEAVNALKLTYIPAPTGRHKESPEKRSTFINPSKKDIGLFQERVINLLETVAHSGTETSTVSSTPTKQEKVPIVVKVDGKVVNKEKPEREPAPEIDALQKHDTLVLEADPDDEKGQKLMARLAKGKETITVVVNSTNVKNNVITLKIGKVANPYSYDVIKPLIKAVNPEEVSTESKDSSGTADKTPSAEPERNSAQPKFTMEANSEEVEVQRQAFVQTFKERCSSLGNTSERLTFTAEDREVIGGMIERTQHFFDQVYSTYAPWKEFQDLVAAEHPEKIIAAREDKEHSRIITTGGRKFIEVPATVGGLYDIFFVLSNIKTTFAEVNNSNRGSLSGDDARLLASRLDRLSYSLGEINKMPTVQRQKRSTEEGSQLTSSEGEETARPTELAEPELSHEQLEVSGQAPLSLDKTEEGGELELIPDEEGKAPEVVAEALQELSYDQLEAAGQGRLFTKEELNEQEKAGREPTAIEKALTERGRTLADFEVGTILRFNENPESAADKNLIKELKEGLGLKPGDSLNEAVVEVLNDPDPVALAEDDPTVGDYLINFQATGSDKNMYENALPLSELLRVLA